MSFRPDLDETSGNGPHRIVGGAQCQCSVIFLEDGDGVAFVGPDQADQIVRPFRILMMRTERWFG